MGMDLLGCVADIECGNRRFAGSRYNRLWCDQGSHDIHCTRRATHHSRLSRWLLPATKNDGMISALVYFFQMARVCRRQENDHFVTTVMPVTSVLGEFSMLRQLALPGGRLCAFRGMNTVHTLVWQISQ
jgi:hypothetical protein